MLEAIIEIGEKILQEQDIIDSRIVKVGITDEKDNPKRIAIIDYDTLNKKITTDVIEMDEDTVFKYLHLGRYGGPNFNQFYVTFTGLSSLIAESISQLILMDVPDDIKEQLRFILKVFYFDWGKSITPKYRYMLDLNKAGIIEETMIELYEKNKDNLKLYKVVQEYLQKEFQKYIEKTHGIKSKQIGLYTLSLNGQPIAMTSWYKHLIEMSLNEQPDESGDKDQLICSYCGSSKGCTADLSEISIKYYTTNQLIFASNFSKNNYNKNMVLCKNCYNKLLSGEKFIQNQMKGKISKLDVYIIPHIVYSTYKLNKKDLYNLSSTLKQSINTANNIDNLDNYKNDLNELNNAVGEGNYFLINLMFYKRMNQATKILKLIKDIHPSIFSKIVESLNLTQIHYEKYFSEGIVNRKHQKGLNLIYYMTPVKLSQQSPAQYQNVLSIYEALFYSRKLSKKEIISNIINCYKINWFEQGEYNCSNLNSREFMDFRIADGLFYMTFLENMGNIERSENMDPSSLNLKDNYKNFINDMKYNGPQASLFLLGCLVGSVGRSQNKKDAENKDTGTYKPVLNKLNFNGMDLPKVKRLSNDIMNKLRQEKILKFSEAIFSEHKKLLGMYEKVWECNKDENLYYILSGYAYETMKKKEEKENE